MIDKREILDMATRMSLTPHVVEKDYVLGWILAGINANPAIRDTWVFKGGTCLKKCYFETYRFSEDLDFTLIDPAQIDEAFLRSTFAEIGDWVYENTGIEVPADKQEFDIYQNPRGTVSCQGKLSYRGPVSSRDLPRVKLDLTADERLVLPPARTTVFHPYTDAPDTGIEILAYVYEEVFGEKVRALAERTRPRDLFDVINLFRNADARPSPAVMLDVIGQKCDFKGIGVPVLGDLEPHRVEFEGLWKSMLDHQLPSLPPYESFWDELPAFFEWLAGGVTPNEPAAYTMGAGETVLRERVLRLPVSGQIQSMIEVIRFAAANRLLVELDYDGAARRIESYSLRQTRDGNVILHAFDVDKAGHRSYRIDRFQGARVTNTSFVPRYEIELTPKGPVRVGATSARVSQTPFRVRSARATRAASSPWTTKARANPFTKPAKTKAFGQPTYIYQCPMCQKKFRRSTMDGKLNAHKNEWGGNCSGRTGYLVDTKY
ncbi:MAG: nucleotidyl transferase AbiEii/AbiGii toxin family protein [Pseudomonadota bacterium]|jgi:predicted nucleotidyltransferase component of viral defense system